jgi:hypothetical protein
MRRQEVKTEFSEETSWKAAASKISQGNIKLEFRDLFNNSNCGLLG